MPSLVDDPPTPGRRPYTQRSCRHSRALSRSTTAETQVSRFDRLLTRDEIARSRRRQPDPTHWKIPASEDGGRVFRPNQRPPNDTSANKHCADFCPCVTTVAAIVISALPPREDGCHGNRPCVTTVAGIVAAVVASALPPRVDGQASWLLGGRCLLPDHHGFDTPWIDLRRDRIAG